MDIIWTGISYVHLRKKKLVWQQIDTEAAITVIYCWHISADMSTAGHCNIQIMTKKTGRLKYPVGKAANSWLPLAAVRPVSMVYQWSEANYYFWMGRRVFLSLNKQISGTRGCRSRVRWTVLLSRDSRHDPHGWMSQDEDFKLTL